MSVRDHPDKKQNYGDKIIMKTKALSTVKAAITGALYAAFTYLSAVMGLAFGPVQFRFSEALTILPIYTPSAVAGLFVGCVVSNIVSTVSPLDMIFGSLATLLAAVMTRVLRNAAVKGFPLLSFLSPVIINGIVIGAEISLLGGAEDVSFTLFLTNALSVAAGEAAVLATLGVLLRLAIEKTPELKRVLGE